MDIFKVFKGCFFCHKKKNLITHSKTGRIYEGFEYHYYHKDCLNSILKNPEQFTSRQVDMAIEIVDQIKIDIEKDNSRKDRRSQKIKEAKAYLSNETRT